ncbi:MAG: CotS family spore coat protein [Clostridium perfringens]|nr:CotS family spore coat protein [Clostridium perfringens]
MDYSYVKELIEKNYGINVKSVDKIKNVYKIKSNNNSEFCLKVINYNYPHFYFIISAIEHLKNRNYENILEIIIDKENKNYIAFKDRFAYLTRWIDSRQGNYDNPIDLEKATINLAKLHKCSEGFSINSRMKPRIYWGNWIKNFETRGKEILDFKNRIYQKAYKSDFDLLYLTIINEELKKVENSIIGLKRSKYREFMSREIMKRGFCHHDYAHHNVLFDSNNNIKIIDFDYCILDTHLHDLGSLCIRVMKDGKWEVSKFEKIINDYSKVKEVEKEEIKILKYFLMFPQGYWQLGIQYYWEQQPWKEEVFIGKILKYINDIKMREEFIEEL